jgi:hypothetical protein
VALSLVDMGRVAAETEHLDDLADLFRPVVGVSPSATAEFNPGCDLVQQAAAHQADVLCESSLSFLALPP